MFHFDLAYLLLFIPIVMVLYSIVPKKYRKYILLLASLFLFWSISGKLVIFVICSSFQVHHFSLWLKSIQKSRDEELMTAEKTSKKEIKLKYQKSQKCVLILAILIHIGLLLTLKYTGFFLENIKCLIDILSLPIKINIPKFILPIGISFYTLEAVSYLVDVYHEKIEAEPNIVNLCLYLSYFPTLIEGPIIKYEEVRDNFNNLEKLKYKNICFGMQRILYGVLKKIVIADRLNILIKTVFNSYQSLSGSVILLGAICYTIQLYMEFSGTMDVALGTSEIFGINLPENFRQPFFSKTISEFWTRWHITLGRWFKDYIFYPVSLSKPMKKLTSFGRKYLGNYYGPLASGAIALFCVWLCNGLWHGAAWKYIFFGMYHFTLILLGNLTEPLTSKILAFFHINKENKIYKLFQILRTFILVVIGELFFRADTLTSGIAMVGRIFTDFGVNKIFDKTFLTLGLDYCDFGIVIITLIIIFIFSLAREKGSSVREYVAKQNIGIRWFLYYALILFILIFGAYGTRYIPVEPIYAEF